MNLPAPWLPMSQAPRDGTDVILMDCDCSGIVVAFWGETIDAPHKEGWFAYTSWLGIPSDADFESETDERWIAWMPFVMINKCQWPSERRR